MQVQVTDLLQITDKNTEQTFSQIGMIPSSGFLTAVLLAIRERQIKVQSGFASHHSQNINYPNIKK